MSFLGLVIKRIKLILSHVQNGCLVFDKSYPISKDLISAMIGLCGKRIVSVKKYVKNKEVETLTSIKGDQRALIIDKFDDPAVRYVSYGISYNINFRNREGSTLAIVVYDAHMIVMEGKEFDLCKIIKD